MPYTSDEAWYAGCFIHIHDLNDVNILEIVSCQVGGPDTDRIAVQRKIIVIQV